MPSFSSVSLSALLLFVLQFSDSEDPSAVVIAHEKGEEEAPAMTTEASRFVLTVLDIILVTGGGSEAVVTVFILLLLLLKQEQHKQQRKEGGALNEENEHALMSFILAVFGFLCLLCLRLPPWCCSR